MGASGGTGGHAVKLLLDQGHEVTAFVRNPETFSATRHERLRLARGEARDANSILQAVQGQDAVLSAFGPRSIGKDDLQEVFMRNLVAAMEKHGVKRLVNLSALGAGDSRGQGPWFIGVIRDLVLGRMFADKERGEAVLFGSSLDYVNVRPGRLLDSAARGNVKSGATLGAMKAELTRTDLAAFMVEQLTAADWVRKSPIVGY